MPGAYFKYPKFIFGSGKHEPKALCYNNPPKENNWFMPDWILQFLDYFFLIFHTLFTLFNALGWLVKKWRNWNLFCLLLTGGSWFILGIFYGMGYCPFTDWHWQILRELGHRDLPYSYIQYLLDRVFYLEVGAEFADTITVVVFFVALAVSVYLNVFDYLKSRK